MFGDTECQSGFGGKREWRAHAAGGLGLGLNTDLANELNQGAQSGGEVPATSVV